MNIFATSPCPVECATALDDSRVVKMVLESAQMLSSAIYICSGKLHDDIYKPTHLKHPCTVWTTSSSGNWRWLHSHMEALCDEYTFRYEKVHRSSSLLEPLWEYHTRFIPEGNMSEFANCTRSESLERNFIDVSDVHLAYRMYMKLKYTSSSRKPRWTKRNPPEWL
jgi:hypothetical protein